MKRLLDLALGRLSTRKCRGNCGHDDFHTHHLSRLGRWVLSPKRPAWRFWAFLAWAMVVMGVVEAVIGVVAHRRHEFVVAVLSGALAAVYWRFDAQERRRAR